MFKKISLIVALIGFALTTSNASADYRSTVIAPKINIGAAQPQPVGYRPAPARRMSAEKFAKLKELTEERSSEMLGPAPAGLRREGYVYINGPRPAGGPCRRGYVEVKTVDDPSIKRGHFRCVRQGSRPVSMAPADSPEDGDI